MRRTALNDNGECDDEELVSRVAWYYYHDGLTQSEVGGRLGLSRIKVSRLLERGRRAGVIGFTIHSGYSACLELESRLRNDFGLREAIVVPTHGLRDNASTGDLNERLPEAAATYLGGFLADGRLLAVGWGDTVTRTLVRLGHLLGATGSSVVSLTGGVSAYIQIIGGLSAALAQAKRLFMIPSPLVVSSAATAAALRLESDVARMLSMVDQADFALVGIGAIDAAASYVKGGYVSAAEIVRYGRQGAVGDVLGRFFDQNGNVLDLEIHTRIVGVEPEALRRLPCVIGVAGGSSKVEAIRATLEGHYLDILITDASTASGVLDTGR